MTVDQDKLENLVLDMQQQMTKIRVDAAETRTDVDGLLRWRSVFEQDTKEALKEIKKQLETSSKEQTTYLQKIEKQIMANADAQRESLQNFALAQSEKLRQATNKLPVWASVIGGILVAVIGYVIEVHWHIA